MSTERDLGYVLETIKTGAIFFGNSFSFNDIFDCRPATIWDCSDEQYIYYAIKRLKKRTMLGARLDEAAAIRGIRARFGTDEDPRSPAGRILAQEMYAEQMSRFGIFCAASRGDNLLMWYHYASSCTGICFEISSAEGNWLPVKYEKNRPVINLSLPVDKSVAIEQSLLVKSEDWDYEEEWRLFGVPGVAKMPPGKLRRVIFGASCDSETREIIRKVICDTGLPITIAAAKASLNRFDFEIISLDLLAPITSQV